MTLTQREKATVLAALRYWQIRVHEFELAGGSLHALYPQHFAEVEALSLLEIDDLCERLDYNEGRALALLQDLVEAFPEFETDEPIVGSDAVDILSAFYKRAQIILGEKGE